MNKYVLLIIAFLLSCFGTRATGNTAVLDCDTDTVAPVIVYPSQNIVISLDDCQIDQPGITFFSLSALDECDENPLLEVVVTTTGGGSYALQNPYGNSYLFLGQPGEYGILITATDESGNQATENFFIIVEQGQPPIPGTGCNDTLNVTLNSNCQRHITPDMLLEGEPGCLPDEFFDIQIQDDQPENGNTLDGVGFFSYEITPQQPADVNGFSGSFAANEWYLQSGPVSSVQFTGNADSLMLSGGFASAIFSLPYSGALSFSLGRVLENTAGEVRLLHLDASANILESNVLTDDAIDVFDWAVDRGDMLVLFLEGYPDNETELANAWLTDWSFEFGAFDFGELSSCWGILDARDQSPPLLSCPLNTDMGLRYVSYNTLSGTLDMDDPTLNTATYSCLIENFNQPGTRYAELIPFEVSSTDFYTFFLQSDFTLGGGDIALFHSFFDPDNPCSNIIAQADVPQGNNPLGGTDPYVRISLPLQAGNTYYLLTTTDEPEATGDFEYWIISDGNGQLPGANSASSTIAYPLYCGDVQQILNTDSLQWTGLPEVSDNCSDVSISTEDELLTSGDCGGIRINRTFEAADAEGNRSSCTQEIRFRRPDLQEVSLPPFTAIIECDEDFPLDEFGNPAPEHTGFPFLSTFSGVVDLNDTYCSIGAAYDDGPLIEVCLLSYQFVRTWTITDWCDPTNQLEYQQVIKIGDFTPPELSAPIVDLDGDGFPDSLYYSTGPFECTAAFSVPLPMVSDNCSTWEVVREVIALDTVVNFDNEGQPIDTIVEEVVLAVVEEDSPNAFVGDIPLGCHLFRYTVTDECDNTSSLDCTFCVEDRVEPVATCDDSLHVSLGPDGDTRLFAVNFDEGSWDNCAIDSLFIRREIKLDDNCDPATPYFTPWSRFVSFDCCDLNDEVTVELLVRDVHGNENTCWAEVLIEDKVKPSCIPPEAVSINCDSLPYGFQPDSIAQLQELFGLAAAEDNCGADWEELLPVVNLDECGFGTLIRRFIATDESGNVSNNSCQQEITVEERHNYEIRFPADGEANCGFPNPLDTITYSEMGCDLLAVSVDDNTFSASGDECYKIFRTYRVINWCEYDGESGPQVISRDEDCDEQRGEEDVWVLRRPSRVFIDRDNDADNNIPAAGEKGVICDGDSNPEGYWRQTTSNGYWEYTQQIKVYDTIPPQILFQIPPAFCSEDNETCRAAVEYPFVIVENCTPDDLDFTIFYDEYADGYVDSVITDIFGVYPKWKVSGDFPIGMHEFEILVTDGCGNTASAVLPFTVADCLAPSPVCINGLAAPLMPVPPGTDADGDGDIDRGALTIFAESFIATPSDDCVGPVTYSINRIGETPSKDQEAIIVTCDDLGALVLEIYAWDAADNPYAVQPDSTAGGPNYDFCETFILVQNHLADCDGGMLQIAGVVEKENGTPVEDVDMQLSGDVAQSIFTDSMGNYLFDYLEEGYDYTLTPYKDGDDQNGLSTFDIVRISEHILGTNLLDSPYEMIAADVNNSGSVSTLDMIQLRQIILSIILEFPNSDSWRFVPKDHVFDNPLNPWQDPIPYLKNYNNLSGSLLNEDYVAIKVGDIDQSSTLSDDGLQPVENRQAAIPYALEVDDKYLNKGEYYDLALEIDEPRLRGLQGVLQWDASRLEVINIREGVIQPAHWNGRALADGRLPISWHNNYQSTAGVLPLFTLRMKALEAVRLSEALEFAESGLNAEIYLEGQAVASPLILVFTPPQSGHLVYPNPFAASTIFSFDAEQYGTSTLTIYDHQGRLVYQDELEQQAGNNRLLLNSDALKNSGLYYYQLDTGTQRFTGKLTLIR